MRLRVWLPSLILHSYISSFDMWQKLPGLVIISAIGLIGVLTVLKTNWPDAIAGPFIDGETQSSIEGEIDEALVIREISVQGWNAFNLNVFNEGRDGVVIGVDNWLFTDEEFEVGHNFEQNLDSSVEAIISSVRHLNEKGVTVVVALLPDKSRIMSEFLEHERPEALQTRYDVVLDRLQGAGLIVPDLRPALLEAKREGSAFLQFDTHWSPNGARNVAQALAPYIVEATDVRSEFQARYVHDIIYKGDLAVFLDTGRFFSDIGSPEEVLPMYQTELIEADQSFDALFGDVVVPAALVGTSYSAIKHWNFIGFLQDISDTDIMDFSVEGQGPFHPMEQFTLQYQADYRPFDVVVWEIPERYISVEPDV